MTDLPRRDPGLPRFVLGIGALAILALLWLLVRPTPPLPGALGAAVESAVSTPETPLDRSGASVFLAQGCGTCHSTTGASTALGPGLGGVSARAAARIIAPDYTGGAGSARDYVLESILDHCADTLPGYTCAELPDLGLHLTTADADALVDFLMRLPAAEEGP